MNGPSETALSRPKSEAGNRREMAVLALIALGGTIFRFAGLGRRQLWLDEIIQLKRFSGPNLLDNVVGLKHEIAAAPLDYLVQAGFVNLWGAGEWAARFHAALFGCLSLPLFYLTARKLFGARVALWALVCFAVYPLHYHYSREGRNYSLFLFLTLCCFYLLLGALDRGGKRRWAAFGAATALNLYTNYLAGLVLLAQLLFLVALRIRPVAASWRGGPPQRGVWMGFAAAGTASVLAFFPWLVFTHEAARGDVSGALSDPWLLLRLFKEISGGGYPLSLAAAIFWWLGLRRLLQTRRWAELSLLLCWGVLPVLMVLVLVGLRGYIFAIRQILFTTPALLLTAAVGLEGLRDSLAPHRAKQATTALLVLIVSLSLGAVALRGEKELADWKGLARHLSEQTAEGDLVLAPDIEFPLSFYLPDLSDRALSMEEGARLLNCDASAPGLSGSSLFLVESRYAAESQKAAAKQLRRSAYALDQSIFQGFAVYRLSCPKPD